MPRHVDWGGIGDGGHIGGGDDYDNAYGGGGAGHIPPEVGSPRTDARPVPVSFYRAPRAVRIVGGGAGSVSSLASRRDPRGAAVGRCGEWRE
jgi:hypothetical protein